MEKPFLVERDTSASENMPSTRIIYQIRWRIRTVTNENTLPSGFVKFLSKTFVNMNIGWAAENAKG
jgi:hypothetical protein